MSVSLSVSQSVNQPASQSDSPTRTGNDKLATHLFLVLHPFYAFFALTPLANLHHFLNFTLSRFNPLWSTYLHLLFFLMGKSLMIYAFLIHAYKHCKRRVAWGEIRYVHTVTFLLVRIERHHSGHLAVNARIILKLTLHSRCDLISKKLYRK